MILLALAMAAATDVESASWLAAFESVAQALDLDPRVQLVVLPADPPRVWLHDGARSVEVAQAVSGAPVDLETQLYVALATLTAPRAPPLATLAPPARPTSASRTPVDARPAAPPLAAPLDAPVVAAVVVEPPTVEPIGVVAPVVATVAPPLPPPPAPAPVEPAAGARWRGGVGAVAASDGAAGLWIEGASRWRDLDVAARAVSAYDGDARVSDRPSLSAEVRRASVSGAALVGWALGDVATLRGGLGVDGRTYRASGRPLGAGFVPFVVGGLAFEAPIGPARLRVEAIAEWDLRPVVVDVGGRLDALGAGRVGLTAGVVTR